MKLIKPSVEILHITTEPLHLIEAAGRTCYKSESKMDGTMENAERFAAMILKRGHESVIEHCSATVRFIVDRGVSHEIVRHRLASYSQESTRYCDYEGGHVAFIIPPWCQNLQPGEASICTDDAALCTLNEVDDPASFWLYSMQQSEDNYRRMRALGWRPEQARSVLPNSLKTEIIMTANLREWRHFFRLRTAEAAHPQMREVAWPLLSQFKAAIPVLFDDIGVEAASKPNDLERDIAYSAARSDIECYCQGNWGNAAPGEVWYDIGSAESDEEKEFVEKAVRYLESRKLLKRHPENSVLVRPLDVE